MREPLRGDILLPTDSPSGTADVVLRVEEVSRADAPSTVTHEHVLGDVSLAPGRTVPFSIEIDRSQLDPRARYILTAHVRVNRQQEFTKGDLITTQSYPLAVVGPVTWQRITVKKI